MRDALDLNFPSTTGTLIYPSKEIEEHGEKLLSISDLSKRLEYYNRHICSLSYSYSNEGLHCYGEYGHYHGSGKVFFRVNSGTDAEFEIYLVERQKETDRLKNLVYEHQEYFEKLKCFIEEKAGQVRFDELEVKSNAWEVFIVNGGGTIPNHLSGSNNEIDLRPSTPAERNSFNLYLRGYIQRLIAAPEALHWIVEQKYEGFLCAPGMEAFKRQLSRVSSKEAAIKAELTRIEKKFHLNSLSDYRDHIYPYKTENFSLWQSALFIAFVNGYEFDYSRKQLTPDEMKALIHVEQVFEYYELLQTHAREIQQAQLSEKQKEIPEWYYEWLNMPVIEKYRSAQKAYFEKFPNGTISDFHLMEIVNHEGRIAKHEKNENLSWFEIRSLVEHRKMLDYYQKLQNESAPISKDLQNADVIKQILERTELNNFLSVPAPDVLHENAFWHDENDSPIDCNIYHPKYGNNGFEATTKDVVVTSFSPVTVYKNDQTGKFIYCQYYLPMLCTADEITFTNKDGEKVIKVDYLQTNQKRLAYNELDFETICQREFEYQQLIDTPEIRNVFYKELIGHTENLIKQHKETSNYKDGRDINVLALAERFIEHLKTLIKTANAKFSYTSKKKIGAPVIGLFCKIVNDAGVKTKDEVESIEAFCKRVCKEFNLRYTDNVRQAFNNNATKRNIEKVKSEILPRIGDVANKIIDYLNNKAPSKQNLYG